MLKLPGIEIYSCRDALVRLDDYLDRELAPHEMEAVARHLRLCRWCAQKFAFEQSALAELRAKLARIDAPADLLQSIQAALDQAPPETETPGSADVAPAS